MAESYRKFKDVTDKKAEKTAHLKEELLELKASLNGTVDGIIKSEKLMAEYKVAIPADLKAIQAELKKDMSLEQFAALNSMFNTICDKFLAELKTIKFETDEEKQSEKGQKVAKLIDTIKVDKRSMDVDLISLRDSIREPDIDVDLLADDSALSVFENSLSMLNDYITLLHKFIDQKGQNIEKMQQDAHYQAAVTLRDGLIATSKKIQESKSVTSELLSALEATQQLFADAIKKEQAKKSKGKTEDVKAANTLLKRGLLSKITKPFAQSYVDILIKYQTQDGEKIDTLISRFKPRATSPKG